MKIQNNSAVSIHFGVAEVDGNALDSTENGAPLEYIHGKRYLVPGLEAELEGKAVGYKFDIKLEAEQAYGPYQEALVQKVPRDLFEGIDTIEVGMSFHAETDQGPRTVEVTEVTDETVCIDANHPLAGMALQFVGEVVGIREATAVEIEHGHVHQAGGCCGGHDHEEDAEHGCCGGHDHNDKKEHECCGGDSSKHAEGESCCGGHGHEHKEKSAGGCCGHSH
jgi:FKBP-type peptidyl-prolyl cis-trans isomerase SlyD